MLTNVFDKLRSILSLPTVSFISYQGFLPTHCKTEFSSMACRVWGKDLWDSGKGDTHLPMLGSSSSVPNDVPFSFSVTPPSPGLSSVDILPDDVLSSPVVPTGIEDKESWHGKPLPKNMADQIIQEIYSQVQSKKKILATPPQEDAPSVDIANIRMPTPPSYKVGDKVSSWLFCEMERIGVGLVL